MILSVSNPICGEVGKIKEFTIEDFRSISFIVENSTDLELEELLESKLIGDMNALTKLLTLMQARMQFVSEQITFNNGTSNVNIDLKFLWKELNDNIQPALRIVEFDGIKFTIDYPTRLIHTSSDDLLIDCIKHISHPFKEISFKDLDQESKQKIIDSLDAKVVLSVKEVIELIDNPINIFKARANLSDITLSLFDNSTFVFIRALFSYYSYDEITELLFILSKRIPDIQYLSSRTPRDLELMIRLYSEEIEKANTDTKSTNL